MTGTRVVQFPRAKLSSAESAYHRIISILREVHQDDRKALCASLDSNPFFCWACGKDDATACACDLPFADEPTGTP